MMDAFELPRTLVQSLQRRAAQTPDQVALRFLAESAEHSVALELSRPRPTRPHHCQRPAGQCRAGRPRSAVVPQRSGLRRGVFWLPVRRVIAVPAYPPESTRRHHQERLLSIISDAEPRLLLTIASLADGLAQIENAPPVLSVDTLDAPVADAWIAPDLQPDDIAFLQYTSGSTALPKGVQVSHGNLVANEVLIRRGFGIDLNPDDVIVSWLPLYHDMGLIGGLLQPIFSGVPCVLMSPAYFLGRPLRWLEAISQYGGTISGGPDFAYRLCSERVSESALERLDLSTWRVAYSGSEPIRLDTLDRFAEKFAACGFSSDNFFASYGLAEATLFVAGGTRGQGIPALRVDETALAANRAEPGQGSAIMSCGTSQPEHAVLIVDPHTLSELPDNRVGELWATGPSIAHGYWRNPEATAKTFVQHAGRTWLRTGDLGFIRFGEVYITGRLKDLLIVRGHNLYPQDIEQTIEREVEVVRKGRVAAFAVNDQGLEGIGIAAEISRSVQKILPPEALIKAIRQAVAEPKEAPSVVVLLQPGACPRPSSWKVQRAACALRHSRTAVFDSYGAVPRSARTRRAMLRWNPNCNSRSRRSGANSCRSRPLLPTITSSCSAVTPSPLPKWSRACVKPSAWS